MTQEELINKIERVLYEYMSVVGSEQYQRTSKQVLQLMNQHVKDVIGEDEKWQYTNDELQVMSKDYIKFTRNELKKEQRKRAGL